MQLRTSRGNAQRAACGSSTAAQRTLALSDTLRPVGVLVDARGAGRRERVELLRVVCVQMAISVENAFLYANLELKVAERTAELRQAQA